MKRSNDIFDDTAAPRQASGRRRTYRSVVVVILMLLIIAGAVGACLHHGSVPLKFGLAVGLVLTLGGVYLSLGEKLPSWVYDATEFRINPLTRPDDTRNLPLPVVAGHSRSCRPDCFGGIRTVLSGRDILNEKSASDKTAVSAASAGM